jgi:SPP1 gp7 family putative phage head morphogenesis protein
MATLRGLAANQKRATLDPLVHEAEAHVRRATFEAKKMAAPALAQFAQAYRDELARINVDVEEGEPPAKVPTHWLTTSQWGKRVVATLRSSAAHIGQQSAGGVTLAHDDAARAGDKHATALIHQALAPVTARTDYHYTPRSALHALHSRIIGKAGNGRPLAHLFDSFGSDAAKRAEQVLYSALINGDGPPAIASELADVLDTAMSQALTIARTELLGAYRDAQLANYRANGDVVGQWLWSATQDAATCAACLGMDGQVFDLDTEMDSHPNCRCSPLPVTNSWDSILGPLGIDTSGLPDTTITANYTSGVDWFNEQDEATQERILGPAKYQAFSNGDITLSDLVGQRDAGAWGNQVYEKSLRELGLDAADYLDD